MGICLTYDNDWVLSCSLIDIDKCLPCGYVFSHFPWKFHFWFLHLFLEPPHCVIITCLAYELAKSCQFTNCNCLIRPFSSIGCHIFWSLDCLSRDRNMMNIHEIVTIGTTTYTDLFACLHSDTKFNMNININQILK